MIDIDMLIDTHTWQYLLVVSPVSHDGHCYEKLLQQLCPEFSLEFSVLIADYDLEDRQRIAISRMSSVTLHGRTTSSIMQR